MSLSNGLAQAMQVIESAVQSAPLAEIPALLGTLERVKMAAYIRLVQKPEPNNGALLTPAQVAERLNVPKSFVYEAARQNQLEPVKLGKKYIRFTEAAVKDYQVRHGS